MKALIIAALLLTISIPSYALLSPLNQSRIEIEMILKHDSLGQLLPSGEGIEEIKRSEDGYTVRTESTEVEIEVKYLPTDRPGPQQFDLIFKKVNSD